MASVSDHDQDIDDIIRRLFLSRAPQAIDDDLMNVLEPDYDDDADWQRPRDLLALMQRPRWIPPSQPGRRPGTGQPIDPAKVDALRAEGKTLEDIAPIFGLSRSQFFERLKELRRETGYQPAPRSGAD